MESLSDTQWDVVISGTGLHQSLLALALSRSGSNILHVDPNEYYGGPEAAFSLQEIDEWAEKHSSEGDGALFAGAEVKREADELGSPGRYTLALAPQLIHSRSKLVSQLVDSKAFRQIEFLAVGSFFIFQPPSDFATTPSLSRIPSTREDVFANTVIPTRSKRFLMKFLKFVLDFDSETQRDVWHPHADEPLQGFLGSEFKLDDMLQSYIITLTLSHDGKVSVKDGLTIIHRHLTSMGVFGPGFAAVYPKWGGLSEVAQVGCRAAAVGGAVYMLGSGINDVREMTSENADALLELQLTNDMVVKTKKLVQGFQQSPTEGSRISRLTAITKHNLSSLFEVQTEGAPIPAVAVVAFPAGSLVLADEKSPFPVYAMVHSSDTGECPQGQYALYLSTVYSVSSKRILEKAFLSLVCSIPGGDETSPIYQLYYTQRVATSSSLVMDGNTATFPLPSVDLAFDDSILDSVREAWNMLAGGSSEKDDYMKFEDREKNDDANAYE